MDSMFGKDLSRLLLLDKSRKNTESFVGHVAMPTVAVLLALALYAIGLKVLFVPALIAVSVWRLPMPRIFTSWLSKVFAGLLLFAGLIQIASSLQFLAFSHSGFTVLAAITSILYITICALAPGRTKERVSIVSATDICGLIVAAFFLLPFTPILVGDHSVLKIADIATVQASDGVRHYISIERIMRNQHVSYSQGNSYPSGFYVPVAFIQHTMFGSQYQLGWKNNAFLYFGDYLLNGSLLGFVIYYICIYWLRMFKKQLVPDGWSWSKLLLAVSLAPVLAVFYLLPFMSEAFLPYYYVCTTFFCGLLFLTGLRTSAKSNEDSLNLSKDHEGRWWLIAYLILMYGASMTWPLLIPPFLVIGILFLVPGHITWSSLRERLISVHTLPVFVAFAMQLIPIYFQMKYSLVNTSQSINTTGGLTQFHNYALFLGTVLVVATIVTTKLEASYRRILANFFLPLIAFLCILMLYQYFTVGAVIYYVIKTSLLIEMLLLAFGVALLVSTFVSSKLYEIRYAWALPVLPLLLILLLIGSINNPLKDDRDIFRIKSNAPLPEFYAQDTQVYVNLGTAGKLQHFNMTSLHYNSAQGKFYANMQGPYWAGALQNDASNQDEKAFSCVGSLYYNLAFGNFSTIDQQQLQQGIKQCAQEAKNRGGTFYVVTDPASAQQVRNFVGNQATVEID